MAFDATTAYAADWRYLPGVEDAELVVRNANSTQDAAYPVKLLVKGLVRPDYQSYGEARLSPDEPGAFLWLLPLSDGSYPEVKPRVDDAVLRSSNQTELVILSVDAPRIGPFGLVLQEAVVNA